MSASLASGRVAFTEVHMGVEARIVVCTDNPDQAAEAARRAFDVIHAWDLALSDWNPQSQAMRLPEKAGERTQVEGRLAIAMQASAVWQGRTEGAFDPALGPLVQLWRQADRTDVWPETPTIEAACRRSGWHALEWREDWGEVIMRSHGVRLDFGGIGQGLAADEALTVLQSSGCPIAMVDISGDMALGTAPPGEPGWRIVVEPASADQPAETLLLASCGVSCSGDRGQPRRIGHRQVSHIVDPSTGMPVPVPRQAVVVAADATRADALATAMCVLPIERCRNLIADDAARAARITRAEADGGLVSLGTWTSLRRSPEARADAPSAPVAGLPAKAPVAAGPPDPTSPAPR
jgi:thiamine biosynthesis lipoprotein